MKIEKNTLFIICPFDFIHITFALKNKFLFKSQISLEKKTKQYLEKKIPNLKIKSLKPDFFEILYFFPVSLFNATFNLVKLIKLLNGEKSYLSSKNNDITGYCLDSLQRFTGNTFDITKKNSFITITISFVFLLFLEIYLNWFISTFKKKKIKKVIINHQVYAESGLFADFSKLIFNSNVYLNKRRFKVNLKLNDVKDNFLNYIPKLKSKKISNKKFFWYEKNSITQNKNFKKKKLIQIEFW